MADMIELSTAALRSAAGRYVYENFGHSVYEVKTQKDNPEFHDKMKIVFEEAPRMIRQKTLEGCTRGYVLLMVIYVCDMWNATADKLKAELNANWVELFLI